jgi:hypothetical protein
MDRVGQKLTDFPWPEGNTEREALKLILSTRPMLNVHMERWSEVVMDAFGRRGGEKVRDVFVEEYLREFVGAMPRFIADEPSAAATQMASAIRASFSRRHIAFRETRNAF